MDEVQFIASSDLVYLAVVTAAAALLALILPKIIHRQENKKINRLESMRRFSPIRTRSPVKEQETKEHAMESVGGRFSIIRKIALVVVGLLWAIAVSFPFLGMVPRTMISILISVTGVMVGIAARPFIENIIAGILISFSKLLRIGDTVMMDEHYGTVEDITLTHTVVKVWDWRRYILPNSVMLGKYLVNYTISDPYIWAHVGFYVAPDADLGKVEQLALQTAREHMSNRSFEQPRFWVMDFEKDSIHCWVAAWSNSPSDAWTFSANVRRELVMRFKEQGIRTQLVQHEAKDSRPRPRSGARSGS
jgi:small-conductance mechanosensitive channel